MFLSRLDGLRIVAKLLKFPMGLRSLTRIGFRSFVFQKLRSFFPLATIITVVLNSDRPDQSTYQSTT
jgi:hypothetical protein